MLFFKEGGSVVKRREQMKKKKKKKKKKGEGCVVVLLLDWLVGSKGRKRERERGHFVLNILRHMKCHHQHHPVRAKPPYPEILILLLLYQY